MKIKKLEIGAGQRPQEGYEHLDVKAFPHIEYVCDARKLPFKDNSYDEIFSHWVLEHFAWREIPSLLLEWKRVLKPGGTIKIVTNNAEAHNKCLLEGKITWKEWNRLIFGIHIDEAGWNQSPDVFECHKIGFNEETLRNFLEEAGFREIKIRALWKCRREDGSINCPGLIAEAKK